MKKIKEIKEIRRETKIKEISRDKNEHIDSPAKSEVSEFEVEVSSRPSKIESQLSFSNARQDEETNHRELRKEENEESARTSPIYSDRNRDNSQTERRYSSPELRGNDLSASNNLTPLIRPTQQRNFFRDDQISQQSSQENIFEQNRQYQIEEQEKHKHLKRRYPG